MSEAILIVPAGRKIPDPGCIPLADPELRAGARVAGLAGQSQAVRTWTGGHRFPAVPADPGVDVWGGDPIT